MDAAMANLKADMRTATDVPPEITSKLIPLIRGYEEDLPSLGRLVAFKLDYWLASRQRTTLTMKGNQHWHMVVALSEKYAHLDNAEHLPIEN
jgi:hypothetical protein